MCECVFECVRVCVFVSVCVSVCVCACVIAATFTRQLKLNLTENEKRISLLSQSIDYGRKKFHSIGPRQCDQKIE
jgi:hypothetical protein